MDNKMKSRSAMPLMTFEHYCAVAGLNPEDVVARRIHREYLKEYLKERKRETQATLGIFEGRRVLEFRGKKEKLVQKQVDLLLACLRDWPDNYWRERNAPQGDSSRVWFGRNEKGRRKEDGLAEILERLGVIERDSKGWRFLYKIVVLDSDRAGV